MFHRLDALLCEQLEGWKEKFLFQIKQLFACQDKSKHHIISSRFEYPLSPIQEKEGENPFHAHHNLQTEAKKLLLEGFLKNSNIPRVTVS